MKSFVDMLTGKKVNVWQCPDFAGAEYSAEDCTASTRNLERAGGKFVKSLKKFSPQPYSDMEIRYPHYFEQHNPDGTVLKRYVFGLNKDKKLVYFDLEQPASVSVTREDVTYDREPVFIDYNYNGKDYLLINGAESGFFVFDGDFDKSEENPMVTGAALYDGKLFACSSDNFSGVKYMTPSAPGSWSSKFTALLVYNECGKAQSLATVKNYIYVFQTNGISRISRAQSDNYSVAKMWQCGEEIYGETVKVVGDEMWFFTSRGLYRFDGGSVKPALGADIFKAGRSSRIALYDGKIFAATHMGGDGEDNNALLVYDTATDEWGVYTDVGIVSFCAFKDSRLMVCFSDDSVAFLSEREQEGETLCALNDAAGRFLVNVNFGLQGRKQLAAIKIKTQSDAEITVYADGRARKYFVKGMARAQFLKDLRCAEQFAVEISAGQADFSAPVIYFSEEN